MTTKQLAAPLIMRAPRPRLPAPPVPLPTMLKTSPALRSAVPRGVLMARAERQAKRAWDIDGYERREAIASMATIVTGTPREPELEPLARWHLIETYADRVLFWEHWRVPDVEQASLAHARAAMASGRGVVISSCHTGPFYRSLLIFRELGRIPWAVCGSWFFGEHTRDYWGRRLHHWWTETYTHLIDAPGSRPTVQRLLADGELVSITFDLPGPRPTQFLGKPMMLAEGTARLAVETGALILPMQIRRAGSGARQEFAPAIDPRALGDVDAVHKVIGDTHERWILEDPASMADPRGFGWNEWATPHSWIEPRPDRPAG